MPNVALSVGPGTTHDTNVNITGVSGSDPWTVTLASVPGDAKVGDALWDEHATPRKYRITAVGASDVTVVDSEGVGSQPDNSGTSTPQIKRYYSSFGDWEDDLIETTNLYSGGTSDTPLGEAYADAAFDEEMQWDNGSGLATELYFYAVEGERHDGTFNLAATVAVTNVRTSGTTMLDLNLIGSSRGQHFSWVVHDGNGQSGAGWVQIGGESSVHHCIFHDMRRGGGLTCVDLGGNTRTIQFHNNLVANCKSTNNDSNNVVALDAGAGGNPSTVVQNTVVDVGKTAGTGNAWGLRITVDDVDLDVKNNIVMNVTSAGGSAEDYSDSLGGLANTDVEYNMSEDDTADDYDVSNSPVNKTFADQFVSTGAPYDYHLKSGSDAINAGLDLGTTPTDVELDIDGETRGTSRDLGFDELGQQTVNVGFASETDTAHALTVNKIIDLGTATEADSAYALTINKIRELGQVSEADTAYALTVGKAIQLGIVTETDSAHPISKAKGISLGIATETDSAHTITPVRSVSLGIVSETDTAYALTPARAVTLGIVTEIDTAYPITRVGGSLGILLGFVTETDTAYPITVVKLSQRKTSSAGVRLETIGPTATALPLTTHRPPPSGAELRPFFSIDALPCLNPTALRDQLLFQKEDHPRIPMFWGKTNSWIEVAGRNPSRGWFLVTGATLKTLSPRYQQPVHTIKVGDGRARSYSRTGILISRYQCVTDSKLSSGDIDPNAAYVIELVDSRYYAGWSSAVTEFNVRNEDAFPWKQQPPGGPRTHFHHRGGGGFNWRTVLWWYWRSTGLEKLLGPITFDAKAIDPFLGPETLKFPGVNAWEAFNRILDSIGWTVAPVFNIPRGGYLVTLSDGKLTKKEEIIRKSAFDSSLHETESEHNGNQSPLPEKVRVFIPSRAYNWDIGTGHGARTSQEYWDVRPVRYVDFPVPNTPGRQIIPGTVKNAYSTLPFITNDQGVIYRVTDLIKHVQSIANNCISKLTGEDFHSATFYGLWPMRTGPRYTGTSFYDLGEGLRSRWYSRPEHFKATVDAVSNLSEREPETVSEEWQLPPDTIRHHKPHVRRQVGIVWAPFQQCYKKPLPFGKIRDGVPSGQWAWVLLIAGRINYATGRQGWTAGNTQFIRAFNATDDTIPPATRVEVDYNYQQGWNGEWNIINHWRQYADVQNTCPGPTLELRPDRWRVQRAKTISVNRQSSLRLGWPRQHGPIQDCHALLENAPGPPHTLFQTRHPSQPPRWVYDAAIHGSMMVGTWYRFFNNGTQSWIGPPQRGQVAFRLPGNKARTGSYLVAGPTNGACVQTQWFGPGLNLEVSFSYAFAGPSCKGSPRCISLTFVNGLLVKVGGTQGTLPPINRNVICRDQFQQDYNPCTQLQQYPRRWFRPMIGQRPQTQQEEQ